MKPKTSQRWGCALGLYLLAAVVAQIVFFTLKVSSAVSWSWWIVLAPILSPFALSVVGIVIAIIVLAPIEAYKSHKKRKAVDKHAEAYGMKRQPGESDRELEKRIVKRNMITGSYTRKDIKDAVLATFPDVASCKMEINNEIHEVHVIVTRAPSEGSEWNAVDFSEGELQEILNFIADRTPMAYKVTFKSGGAQDGK